MRVLFAVLALLPTLTACEKPSESSLPICKTSDSYWKNCFGRLEYPPPGEPGRPPPNVYVGEFKNHQRHGRGTMTSNEEATLYSLECYKGDWKYEGDWWKYEGDWRDDKRNGQGIATALPSVLAGVLGPRSSRYEGGWKDDRHHGEGTLICDGHPRFANYTFVGNWEEGMFVRGKVTNTNSTRDSFFWRALETGDRFHTYEGEWDLYGPTQGTMTSHNGIVLSGRWKDGKFLGP